MKYGEAVTDFQKKVYDALLEIPSGKVTTYALLASYIGCASSQAVGQALKKNPCAPKVPCHRVIKSDLSIGGFMGEAVGESIKDKINLLESEGVLFNTLGYLEDKSQVFKFENCR